MEFIQLLFISLSLCGLFWIVFFKFVRRKPLSLREKETNDPTKNSIQKNPYAIRKLINKWVLALVLMCLVIPFLADIIEIYTRIFHIGISAKLIYMPVAFAYLIYMVVWTVRFFVKRYDKILYKRIL